MEKRKLTILLENELKLQLDHRKEQTGASLNWMINKAIQEWLDNLPED